MRVVYFLLLLLVLGAVGLFAAQNNESITLLYLDRSISTTLPLLIGAVYLLGMVSGWTVIGFLTRSFRRVTDRRVD
ncbi:MAG: lipopolysaccharide assembly protein LapA domain-containing protein [Gemmataceae bacterium]